MEERKDDLVTRLENKPNMDWALRAWILHRQGYTNRGGHWHTGAGVSTWKPKKQGKK